MTTYKILYQDLQTSLQNVAKDFSEQEARIILEKELGISWSDLIAYPNKNIDSEYEEKVREIIYQRSQGRPLSHIYGEKEFWGMNFKVNEHVLDPRPDSETLIEYALTLFNQKPPQTILDLGTGSGCLLLSLLKEFPDAQGVGVDLSPEALKIAKYNAQSLGLDDRVQWIESSWLDKVNQDHFDLIISNPPYIRSEVIPTLSPEVQKYDPLSALDGGIDGLDCYKEILLQIKNKIKSPVRILFEIGFDQEKSLTRLLEESPFSYRCTQADLSGNPRVVDISSGDK